MSDKLVEVTADDDVKVTVGAPSSGGGGGPEVDPTVPEEVKVITQSDIDNWNSKASQTALNSETSARTLADAALADDIDQEVLQRQAADDDLQDAITQESTDRQDADELLQDSIDQEISDREDADDALQAQITQEVSDRNTAVSNEATARANADTALSDRIAALELEGGITVTGNTTLGPTHVINKRIDVNSASQVNITIPLDVTTNFAVGTRIFLFGMGAGLVVVVPTGGVTLRSRSNYTALNGQGSIAVLRKRAANDWVLSGDIKAQYDSDAEAYMNAVGTFSDAEKGYINTFVLTAKADGWWTSRNVIYLNMGGTAAAHKFNLKNPLDSDAAFRKTYTGSPTHSSLGEVYNGSTQYADTKFAPSSYLSQNDKHYAIRLKTDNQGSAFGAVNGSVQGDHLIAKYSDNNTYFLISSGSLATVANGATGVGFWSLNRTASNSVTVKRNDSLLATNTSASGTNPAINIYIGARNAAGSPALYNSCTVQFFSAGPALTGTQETSMYNAVEALQTSLGRS